MYMLEGETISNCTYIGTHGDAYMYIHSTPGDDACTYMYIGIPGDAYMYPWVTYISIPGYIHVQSCNFNSFLSN